MKKKLITICITLLLLFCSVVPTFALDTVINTHVDYWLYDLMLQTLNENTSNATWGYVLDNSNNPTMGYYAMVLDPNSAAIYEYNVKPGDTVYFRWGVSNFHQARGTTSVKTVVDGTVVNTTNYTVGSGEYNSGYSVFICDDYTNTSNYTQTVTFSLRNEIADYSTTYLPVKCGLQIYFDEIAGEVTGDTTVNIDLSYIEETLEIISNNVYLNNQNLIAINSNLNRIYDTLTDIYDDVNKLVNTMYTLWEHVPIEFSKVYSYYLNGFSATFINNFINGPSLMPDNVLPFISINVPGSNAFSSERAINVSIDDFYFSIMFETTESLSRVQGVPAILNFEDGSRRDMTLINLVKTGNLYTGTYKYTFTSSDRGKLFSLYFNFHNKFIPIYFGYPFLDNDITETQMAMSGISLYDAGNDRELNNVNKEFKDVASNLNKLEQEQISNLNSHLNNIPTLDFNAFNDFAPTVQFVSGTLQQIYDSNVFLQLLINAGLVIGIALLIIGRKT